MKPLVEVLENLRDARDKYDTCKLTLPAVQCEIARTLAVNLCHLAEHKAEIYQEWLDCYTQCPEKTDGKREKYADGLIPSLYMVTQVYKASENLLSVVRSTISANK